MENKVSQPTEDGQESNSATEAVAEVLAKHTKKPRFLQHVGIQHVHARSSDSNCQAELAAEKRGNVELRALVDTLTKQLKESEEARARQDEEHRKRDEENRKKQDAMDAKLDFLLSQLQARSSQE
jgi:hypothetical protein